MRNRSFLPQNGLTTEENAAVLKRARPFCWTGIVRRACEQFSKGDRFSEGAAWPGTTRGQNPDRYSGIIAARTMRCYQSSRGKPTLIRERILRRAASPPMSFFFFFAARVIENDVDATTCRKRIDVDEYILARAPPPPKSASFLLCIVRCLVTRAFSSRLLLLVRSILCCLVIFFLCLTSFFFLFLYLKKKTSRRTKDWWPALISRRMKRHSISQAVENSRTVLSDF